jgi:hypothetical protein
MRRALLWFLALSGLVVMTEIHVHTGKFFAALCMSGAFLIWYAFFPQRNLARRLLYFELGFTAFWVLAVCYMILVDWLFPFKYDSILARIDSRWLFDGTALWRLTQSSATLRAATDFIYLGLKNAVIFWYGWHVATNCEPKKFFTSLGIAYIAGPAFYLLVPACGPQFLTSGLPNCVPSLHMVTAILMIVYRPVGGLIPSLLFAIATAFVTIATGQHYVMDLVLALPFSVFVWAAVERRWKIAAAMLAFEIVLDTAIHMMSR